MMVVVTACGGCRRAHGAPPSMAERVSRVYLPVIAQPSDTVDAVMVAERFKVASKVLDL